jgi:hypothetical protein
MGEETNYKIMEIVEKHSAEFAYPDHYSVHTKLEDSISCKTPWYLFKRFVSYKAMTDKTVRQCCIEVNMMKEAIILLTGNDKNNCLIGIRY